MDRVWQWAWDRHGPRWVWVIVAVTFPILLPIYGLMSLLVAVTEDSHRYLATTALTLAAAVTTLVLAIGLPPIAVKLRPVRQWALGDPVDPSVALASTYDFARGAIVTTVIAGSLSPSMMQMGAALLAGAEARRVAEWAACGALTGLSVQLISVHGYFEASLRPARVAIAGDAVFGDSLPRPRPTFAHWSIVAIVATAFAFSMAGATAMTAVGGDSPAVALSIAIGMTVLFAMPITVGTSIGPSLRPIRDLAEATERVAAGDYSQRLPVVQDDDLGALAGSFNRMQAGLAERERLQSAFGTYVDPLLASRLLEQGDDVFTGERREVTVMFIDIREFTPYAEANTAEDTVARLNELFEIVVPAVVASGGHVNKFLGDGALAVFGAPNVLPGHADAALRTAIVIQGAVAERFAGDLRIGVGINTGSVIAGTIGGGGKLEFTLIGDTVNVAARVEQVTKSTGDAILLTDHSRDALVDPPVGLVDRGLHELKGKSSTVRLYGLESCGPL